MQIATEHQNQHLPACIGSGDVVTSFGIVFIEVLYNSVLVLFLCVVVLFILLRDVFNVVCIVFVWGRKVWPVRVLLKFLYIFHPFPFSEWLSPDRRVEISHSCLYRRRHHGVHLPLRLTGWPGPTSPERDDETRTPPPPPPPPATAPPDSISSQRPRGGEQDSIPLLLTDRPHVAQTEGDRQRDKLRKKEETQRERDRERHRGRETKRDRESERQRE